MKNFVCLLISFVLIGAMDTKACQNLQAGIFTKSPRSFVVKAKVSNDPINDLSFDNVVVTVFWEKSLNITLGTVNSPYGIAPVGPVGTEGIFCFQKFVGAPGVNITWAVNSITELFAVEVSGTGPALFELRIPTDPSVHGEWYFAAGGINFTNTDVPFFAPSTELPLPVSLGVFSGCMDQSGAGVRLQWRTLSEVNNYGFTVQRKERNELDYLELDNAFIAGKGTTVEPQAYSYVDNTVTKAGEYAYRLKQQDLDGTVHFTGSVVVQVTATDVAESAPQMFQLLQNYPNPFNPSTKIGFGVSGLGSSWVRLAVYDLLGCEVAVLVNEQMAPGTYSVEFNAVGLPSGAYYYKLTTGNSTDVKRMLLLR
jgi:hypothetical protein